MGIAMDERQRLLAYQLVEDQLRQEAPEFLPALAAGQEAVFRALPARPESSGDQHSGGLPLDLPLVSWTLVSAAIWVSANLVTEALRHREDHSRERALDRLEVRLAEQTADPLLINDLRRRLEGLAVRLGGFQALLEKPGSTLEDEAGQGNTRKARPSEDSIGPNQRRLHVSGTPPDLEILIRRDWTGGREHLVFELTAANLSIDHQIFTSKPFEKAPSAHVGGLLSGVTDVAKTCRKDPVLAAEQLSAIGAALSSSLLPSDLENLLWSLRGRVATIQIVSHEPYIPWELIKIRAPAPGDSTHEPFLCEAFAIARWLPCDHGRVSCLPLARVATVVSRDGNLGKATPEIEVLIRESECPRTVEAIPALVTPIVEALAAGRYDGWYFATHGDASAEDPEAWALRLDDYQRLQVRVLEDKARGLVRARPLVFLNCCHSGRASLALTGTAGWSSGFVRAGAGAFLGCYWAVDDQKAHELAREFYRGFLTDGLPLAEALRQARHWLRERYPGDPTWLAYTLFGHPAAVSSAPQKRRAITPLRV